MARGVLCAVLLMAGTAWGEQRSPLVGTWVGDLQGLPVQLVLQADGTGNFIEEPIRWRSQSAKLLLTDEEGTEAYDFVLQGTRLTLSGGDLAAPLGLSRTGSAAGGPSSQDVAAAVESTRETPPGPESRSPSLPTGTTRPKKALAESELVELLEANVPSRRLVDLVEERGISFGPTSAALARLKAKGASGELIEALRRAGSARPEAASPTGKMPPSRGTSPSRPGSRYTQDQWGLSFAVPQTWLVSDRKTALLLGSQSEPGLIVIRFMRRTNLQSLAEGYQEGLEEEGLQLMPTSGLESFSAGGAQGLAGEMVGIARDGARMRARAVAVPSPYGDAVVVLGLTTEEKYPQLKPRVDALAQGVSFAPPQAPPVNESVAGQYLYF